MAPVRRLRAAQVLGVPEARRAEYGIPPEIGDECSFRATLQGASHIDPDPATLRPRPRLRNVAKYEIVTGQVRTLGFAIVGCGRISKRHLELLWPRPSCQLPPRRGV